MNAKHDAIIDKERELYSNRIKDYCNAQELEIQNIRTRWNQELNDERARIEQQYKDEIRIWQERAKIAEEKLKNFKSNS
jgi:gas vesicle protein